MSATREQKFEELRRAYEELRQEHDAALAALSQQQRSSGLDTSNVQTADRDFGVLKTENEELRAAQAAGLEVLQAMVASPGETRPVLDLIARQAAKLCDVPIAVVTTFDGTMIHLVAHIGMESAEAEVLARQFPRPPSQDIALGRAILNRRIEQIEDITADPHRSFTPPPNQGSVLAVPLLRDDAPLGAIAIGRRSRGRFPRNQITLLQIFAEQAVIAITSAETYSKLQARTAALAQRNTEYGERIEHQSATIDVLKAMSHSPGDPQPVFELIVHHANKLCDGTGVGLFEFDGRMVHLRANLFGDAAEDKIANYRAMFPMVPNRGSITCRAILDKQIMHITDLQSDPEIHPAVKAMGYHSQLSIPLMRDGAAIGVISLGGPIGGFTDSQVALLQTFAEQAVIAIGSAATYRALQERTAALAQRNSEYGERIEQQAATIDVLKVMSGSPDDPQPVFDQIAERARAFCETDFGAVTLVDGDLIGLRALAGTESWVAQVRAAYPVPISPASAQGRAILTRSAVRIADTAVDPEYTLPGVTTVMRSVAAVPLLRDGVAIGGIGIGGPVASPFSDIQMELLRTFAEQAVIAIRSAETFRVLRERTRALQESLEYQTATSDILGVISRSTFDLQPVLTRVAETAARLCIADQAAIFLVQGNTARLATNFGFPPEYQANVEQRGALPILRDSPSVGYRALAERRIVHIHDVAAVPDYPETSVILGRQRTSLGIPLMREGEAIGLIMLARQRVEPFTERQIDLVSTFADQAVIAIENTRLLTEQREALEQQTATAEVLQVINASPGEPRPVFNALLEKAMRLCGAAFGSLYTYDGTRFHSAAQLGVPTAYSAVREKTPPSGQSGGPATRILQTKRTVHILDMASEEAYQSGNDGIRALVELGGARTILGVPLLKDGALLGYISIYRQEVRAFSGKETALLENFAAQAVIAMENARLLTEQREALEQQTATAEVLQVINSSPGDLTPVFDAILEKAHSLCAATRGAFVVLDGEEFQVATSRGLSERYVQILRDAHQNRTPSDERSPREQLLSGASFVQRSGPVIFTGPIGRAGAELENVHAVLFVPLRRDGRLLGYITAYRERQSLFSHKQIAVLQSFAAQAVIAMENARLINETREALERQTATAEILRVINTSPGNLTPVFDALLERALRLCESSFGILCTFDGEFYHTVATRDVATGYADLARAPVRPVPGMCAHDLVLGKNVIHLADVTTDASYDLASPFRRALADHSGARTAIWVALRHDNALLGMINIFRSEVRPFSDQQIALLQNFAAQAVIAMENARLMNETREALERQTAMAEVLQVINTSPGHLAPVFDAVLEKAIRLCGSSFGTLSTYDGHVMQIAASHGLTQEQEALLVDRPPAAGQPTGQIANGEDIVHLLDARDQDGYRDGFGPTRFFVDQVGARTVMWVALRKDQELLGILTIFRREVRAFIDKEIALVRSFAAQAVIAMENARLINEQREALEQQIATTEVLRVINESPGTLAPVFDKLLDKARAVCGVDHAALELYDGERFYAAAVHGASDEFAELLRQGYRADASPAAQALLHGEAYIEIADATQVDLATFQAAAAIDGVRTVLFVPLRREKTLLGMIASARREVRKFTEKEISLLQNFAAQAVVAMENARLLAEQREALERQTATAEVLQVINASPGNLAPVFDALLEKAMRLCGAAFGILFTFNGEFFHAVAMRGVPTAYAEFRARTPAKVAPGSRHARMLKTKLPSQFLDLALDQSYQHGSASDRAIVDLGGARTVLYVPLIKDESVIGTVAIYRQEVRPFLDKQIALLENFAAQAVIAMENARLLNELRQRQEELRITFENMGDGVAMFDETQHLVAWNSKFQKIFGLPDDLLKQRCTYEEHLRFLAERGYFGAVDTAEQIHALVASTGQSYGYERTLPDGRVIEIRRNPVPDGGFVLIFSDITERKRSEEEIRAARDAAEAAYRDLKTAQASLIQAEKMASLGQLTAGIAHEIKNPLNFVNNFASLSVDLLEELKQTAAPGLRLLDDARRAEVDDMASTLASNLVKINEHGRRADGIVRSMLEHSRGSSGERRSVDLNALIEEALNLAYHGARAQDQTFNISLQRQLGEGIAPITLAPQDITRVLLNLFSNGFYAARERQRAKTTSGFQPSLKVSTRQLDGAVEILVRDNGIGIPAEIKDRLFQPFFTTKPPGEGTGLGLSMSYDIITQQHGGTISVDSKAGEYSEFTIRLPRNA